MKTEDSRLECLVCHAVIPPDAKCCEHCETGFAVANEKWDQRYERELDRQHDEAMQEQIQADKYLGERL